MTLTFPDWGSDLLLHHNYRGWSGGASSDINEGGGRSRAGGAEVAVPAQPIGFSLS